MSTIGERMRELRGSSTLREMADAIGIKYNAWARYEAGGATPGGDIIANICRTHRCSADWLLGLSDKSSPNISTHGNNSPVVTGSHNSVTLGESWQCAKCPYKKKLKTLEKAFKQTFVT